MITTEAPLGRIVVATAPLGQGHTSAARAIAAELGRALPETEIEVIDVTSQICRRFPLSRILREFYRFSATRWHGIVHAAVYATFDRFPIALSRIADALWGRQVVRSLTAGGRCDLIIVTFPVVSFILTRRLHGVTPVLTQVTDAGHVNRIWFAGRAEHVMVVDEASFTIARDCGLSASSITIAGPPLSRDALEYRVSKQVARSELGLMNQFVILFTAGGDGLGCNVLRAARLVANRRVPVVAILNAGDNLCLYRRFARLRFRQGSVLVAFSENFDTLLAACDIVVGKAGLMTLVEAAQHPRPTLIVEIVPGQERGNAQYAIALGTATAVSSTAALDLLTEYVRDPSRLERDFCLGAPHANLMRWPGALVECVRLLICDGSGQPNVGRRKAGPDDRP